MRQLLPIFVLLTTWTTAACAQDSVPPQEPGTTQSRSGYDGYLEMARKVMNHRWALPIASSAG